MSISAPPVSPKRILLIEDSDDDALLFERAVKESGLRARIDRVKDGRTAIGYIEKAAAKSAWPHLIFVDWNMPVMDGCNFLRWLRVQHPDCQSIIIVLTSTEGPHDLRNIMALAVTHWTKPAKAEKL